MISKIDLDNAWASIMPGPNETVGRRADASHPLDFFITYDENQNMQLMLLAEFQPSLPKSSKQIRVRGNNRKDGKYAICFSLIENKLREQFVSLCWDLMNSTILIQGNKKQGILAAIKRFTMWQNLFAELKKKEISDSQIKGLLGELYILKNLCIPKYGANIAISGWVGPLSGDRDFEYADYWFESKYVPISKDRVKISSLDQLDTDEPGFLVLVRAEKASPEATNVVSINRLISSIKETAAEDVSAEEAFNNRLMLYGYSQGDTRADEGYVVSRAECYFVNSADFPRIRRSQIDPALTDGEYYLSIPALQQWQSDIEID